MQSPPSNAASNQLESVDDMAAFVERTRLEEETMRRKREEVRGAEAAGSTGAALA